MKVYSPSQTSNFLSCPYKWRLGKDGWFTKSYNKGSLYAIRGSAVSAGLEHFITSGSLDIGLAKAREAVAVEWEKSRIPERQWSEFRSLPLAMAEISTHVAALVTAYAKNPPTAFTVLHNEYVFKDHGNSRADLIAKLVPSGDIIPVDFKCKDVPATAFFQFSIKQDYRFSWQLMHYIWATSETFRVNCLQFGIVVLWYAKKCKIEYVPFEVYPERLTNWYNSARVVWARMEACENGEEPLNEVANHRDQFGPCEFSTACLEYNRDETKMAWDYLRKGK